VAARYGDIIVEFKQDELGNLNHQRYWLMFI